MVAVTGVIDQPSSESGEAIDIAHLSRMTLGEHSLKHEVLALFDRQADILLLRIRGGAPAVAAVSAHTLRGSAAGIGAFKVARAVEAVEQTQGFEARDAAVAAAIDTLAVVLGEAKAEIARLLQTS